MSRQYSSYQPWVIALFLLLAAAFAFAQAGAPKYDRSTEAKIKGIGRIHRQGRRLAWCISR